MKLKNTLIRFEDYHGLFDLFELMSNNPIEIQNIDNHLIYKLNNGLLIERGLSTPRVLEIRESDIDMYNSLNIDTIIIIFDLDNIAGLKKKIITKSQFNTYVRRNKYLNAYSIFTVKYIPTTYAAESIILYYSYKCSRDISEIVSSWDTNKLHLALVKHALDIDNSNSGKNVIDLIDKEVLYKNLKLELESNNYSNKVILNFLLGDYEKSKLMDNTDVIVWLEEMNVTFDKRVKYSDDKISIDENIYYFPEGSDKLIKIK